ncbi:hypothetical protein VitviT2T_012443 [Vitis vinifera]|nr:uncharacterized protein LOC100263174 [Vitis vinifera]WJZ93510.1 hypothetical protein VitviT2T_012443 [Vitis vinifera]|eukprot:XP_002280536.1 PREDICTED: uncharacterized protein LOC100263174 [Vitis vinifera]
MAEFPPNLDDGELWLPSDIFPEEVPSKFGTHHLPSEFAYMSDIARQFAAFTLLQPPQTHPKHPLNLAPNLERLRPMIRYGPYGRPGCSTTVAVTGIGDSPCVCDSPCGCDCRLRSCWDGGRPLYEYRNVKPPQPQVDSFLQTRTLALQRHQNRFQNRSLPFQRSGSGLGGGGGGGGGFGFVRNYGGTGVFLPRISSTTTTSPNPTATDDSRKKQGMNNWHGMQVSLPRKPTMNGIGGGKQEECIRQLPPELALPQDWTY